MKWLAGVIASIMLSFPIVSAAACHEFYGEQFRTDRATVWGNGMVCDYPGQSFVIIDFYQAQDFDGNYHVIDASWSIMFNGNAVYVGFNQSYPDTDWFSMTFDPSNGTDWRSADDYWHCSDPFCGSYGMAEDDWDRYNTP